MIIVDPGHKYHPLSYDPEGKEPAKLADKIDFFKKIGEGFPGNEGFPSWGTNCQELLRILIDRVKYLDNQIECRENKQILYAIRLALYFFEVRAAKRKNKTADFLNIEPQLGLSLSNIENVPHCNICGHIYPHSHTRDKP